MHWDLLFTYKAWALETSFFERMYPVVMEMIRSGAPLSRLRKLNPNLKENKALQIAEFDRESGLYLFGASGSSDPSVAFIPVLGSLTKRGDLCSYGMMDYIKRIQSANKSKRVDSIVIEMESPGGTVDGTPEFAKVVRESEKPVVIFGDGLVASAAYWVSSQADLIVANADNYVDFGSIGALYVYENWSKYIEKEIGEIRIIRAPQSKDKALINPIEPLTSDQEKEIRDELRTITDFFIQTVKAGRGDKLNADDKEIFTGKMFDKERSLEMGLIDSIGTLQDAIDASYLLAHSNKGGNSKSNTQSKNMKFPKLSSLFGKAEEEAHSEDLSAEEQASLEAIETKLAENEEQVNGLQAQISDLENQISTLNQEKTLLQEQISAKDQEIQDLQDRLAKKPAGEATTALSNQDQGPEYKETKEDQFRTSLDDEADQYRAMNGKPKEAEAQEK